MILKLTREKQKEGARTEAAKTDRKTPFCLPVTTITAIIVIIVVVEMTNTATDRAPI